MTPERLESATATRRSGTVSLPSRIGAWLLPLGMALLPVAGPAAAEDAGAAATPLRLCADPTDPPFSSSKASEPGFYLELGQAIGKAMDRPVEPVWEMTYYGKRATRETLLAGKCDMSIGLPAEGGFMGKSVILSHPFIAVGFALVTPPGMAPKLASLHGKRVAVQLGTPAQSVVADHDDITAVTFVNPDDPVQAVVDGKADAAFVWGPSAGYLNHVKLHDRFAVTPIAGPGMQWHVAIGFSAKQVELRDQVDRLLPSLQGKIDSLAAKYGFPGAAPVSLTWAPLVPRLSSAALTRVVYDDQPARLPVLRVADVTTETSDDQKDAADRVAPNRGDVDIKFKPASDAKAVEEGRTVFNGTCNHCHGPDAVQSVKKIDLRLLRHRYGGAMDQVFHYTVTHGRESKGMPNWSGVFTEDDFSKILAFLHSVQAN